MLFEETVTSSWLWLFQYGLPTGEVSRRYSLGTSPLFLSLLSLYFFNLCLALGTELAWTVTSSINSYSGPGTMPTFFWLQSPCLTVKITSVAHTFVFPSEHWQWWWTLHIGEQLVQFPLEPSLCLRGKLIINLKSPGVFLLLATEIPWQHLYNPQGTTCILGSQEFCLSSWAFSDWWLKPCLAHYWQKAISGMNEC